MNIQLVRYAYLSIGTFGRLMLPGFNCLTVERPWRLNERNVSCIPIGSYEIKLGVFHRGTADPGDDYPAYEILDVPGRSLVKIHIANVMYDVKGCVGVGRELGWMKTRRAPAATLGVTHSTVTYGEFLAAMAAFARGHLEITNYVGGRL